MATRQQIKEAFYTEIKSAVPTSGNTGHVPDEDIGNEDPESDEDIPSIVYDDNARKVPINRASSGPTRIERDQNDDAVAEHYGTLHEMRFDVLFWFVDEVEKEACYEAVRTYFEKYEEHPWNPSDIHTDVKWVRVNDAQSDNDADANPVRHGDRLQINLTFLRELENSGTAVSQVNHDVDADDDGTTDATWTST